MPSPKEKKNRMLILLLFMGKREMLHLLELLAQFLFENERKRCEVAQAPEDIMG